MAIQVKNNSKRLIEEIYKLKEENKGLSDLLFDLRDYVQDKFGKDIYLTQIYRLQEEQDEYYKNNERYKKKKFKSPHQFYHAFDLSVYRSNFSDEECEDIIEYLTQKYDENNYYKTTAFRHDIGHGDHFHVQYYNV